MEAEARLPAGVWFERHWPSIEDEISRGQRHRVPEGRKSHFERVVRALDDRFDDPVLCQAAALHGLRSDQLGDLDLGDEIEPEVQKLLEERERLRALEGEPDMADRLARFVLPELVDPRSVMLLIVEQLDHFDPAGEMLAWTGDFFHGHHTELPDLPTPDGSFDSLESQLSFLHNVIAPTCDFFSLWREKWLAKDLCLYHSDRRRFEAVRRFTYACAQDDRIENELAFVRSRLTPESEGGPIVRWEWRSVSAIAESFGDGLPTAGSRIGRRGFVVISCPETEDCYRVLGELHTNCTHRFGEIRDFIGAPAVSGYRALHTELVPEKRNDTITVHILAQDESRHQLTGKPHLSRLRKRVQGGKSLSFRVFTKDGQPLELPVGSCVLNFALKVHNDFVALARKATVNRKPVDLLYRLQPGDVVWLDIGETPRYLPEGWEERVPKNTVQQIRKEFRRRFRPALRARGLRALRRRLAERSLTPHDADESLLVTAIRNADAMLKAKGVIHEPKQEARWLRQLALLDTEVQGGLRMHRLEIDEGVARQFVDLVAAEIEKIPNLGRSALELPEALRGKVVRIDASRVRANAETMKGKLSEEGVLELLPADAPEGEVIHRRLSRESPFFFLIECRRDLQGLLRALEIIQDEGGEILDLAANRTGGGGVARVHLQVIDRFSMKRIRQRLLELPDISRITAPGETEPPFLSAFLPSKTSFATDISVDLPLPFRAGAPVRGEHFYGREPELQFLKEALQGRLSDNAGNGIVFVTGPLREGKSSLANEFIRRSRLNPDLHVPLVAATVESAGDTSWRRASEEMSRKLWSKAIEQAEDFQKTLTSSKRSRDIQETVEALQEHTRCAVIMVFDEVVKLLGGIQNSGEAGAFERFWAWAKQRERLLVILVGPFAPLQSRVHLGDELARMVSNVTQIRLRPLDKEQATALLQAKKQQPAIQIEAPKIQHRVYRLTGGQPMWIQKLAEAMHSRASQRRSDGRLEFSRNDCNLALDHIYRTAQIQRSLHDRLFHAVDDRDRVLAVFRALTRGKKRPQSGHRIVDIQRYLLELQEKGAIPQTGFLDTEQLQELLLELEYLGALERSEFKRWHVSSDLVFNFAKDLLQSTKCHPESHR